jgi:uncharacterized protein YdhG (YjbR/CyaY superfamily)
MDKNKIKTIEGYIKKFPPEVRKILEKIRQIIKKAAPGAEEAFGYGVPAFKLNGKWLVYFAAFKNHVGFYPTPSGIAAFEKELSGYELSEGTIRFPLSSPIPYDLLKRIAAFRVKQILKK